MGDQKFVVGVDNFNARNLLFCSSLPVHMYDAESLTFASTVNHDKRPYYPTIV